MVIQKNIEIYVSVYFYILNISWILATYVKFVKNRRKTQKYVYFCVGDSTATRRGHEAIPKVLPDYGQKPFFDITPLFENSPQVKSFQNQLKIWSTLKN